MLRQLVPPLGSDIDRSGRVELSGARRRYIVVETAISIAINVVVSIGFVFLMFGGASRVATASLIADAAPQGFMIALMSTIVPTLLTRRRRRAGTIAFAVDAVPRLRWPLFVRALLAAAVAAGSGVALHAALLPALCPDGLGFAAALALKACYGGAVALGVTPVMLRLALSETI